MTEQWKPDISDNSIITREKMDHIVASAEEYMHYSSQAFAERTRNASNFLLILLPMIATIAGYIMLNCDILAQTCSPHTNLFGPAIVILSEFSIAAFLLIFGVLSPRKYNQSGNEPANILTDDYCKDNITVMKIRRSIRLQEHITQNKQMAHNMAFFLELSYILTLAAPIGAFIGLLLTH